MRFLRRYPRAALSVTGILFMTIGYVISGDFLHGFSTSIDVYLTHAGIYALVLSVILLVFSTASQDGWKKIIPPILAFIFLYMISIGMIWYDLAVTPPQYYSPNPTLTDFASDRFGFILSLAPLVAGYTLGVASQEPTDKYQWLSVFSLLLLVSGPITAYLIAVRNASHPGFVLLHYSLLGVVGVVGSIPFYTISKYNNIECDG